MTTNLIDITGIIQKKQLPIDIQRGMDAIYAMDPQTGTDIMAFILNYIITEIQIGLGLREVDDYEIETPFFDKVHAVYQEAASGCYFCSEIDPNECEFGLETKLCLECQLKLANFVQAIGIDSSKIFKIVSGRRMIQKSTVKSS